MSEVRRRTIAVVAASILVLVGASCSDADDEPPVIEGDGTLGQLENPDGVESFTPPETVPGLADPCALVTSEEVASITGEVVVSTERSPLSATDVVCDHIVDDLGSVGTAVRISTEGADEELELHTSVEDAEPVAGLGQQASWSELLGTLAVVEDGTLLSVNRLVVDADPDQLRDQAERVAEIALGRLTEG